MVLLPFRHSVIGFSKLLYAFIYTHFWSFTCSLALIWLRWPGSFINNSHLIISSLCTLCQSVSQSASNGTSGVFHCSVGIFSMSPPHHCLLCVSGVMLSLFYNICPVSATLTWWALAWSVNVGLVCAGRAANKEFHYLGRNRDKACYSQV